MVASRSRMPSLVTSPTRAKWPPPTERHSPDSGQSAMREPAHERRDQARVQPVGELVAPGDRPEPGARSRLGRRHDDVGGDAVGLALARHRAGQADHAHLRHAVDRAAGHTAERRARRDVDEATATVLRHELPRRAAHVQHAAELGVDHRVDQLVGERRERRHAHLARVVHHDVDGAERVERRLHDRDAAVRRGDGVGVRDRLAAGGADLVDDVVRRVLRGCLGPTVGVADAHAEVVDHDACATRREQQRVLAPEVATGAGDDRHLAVEAELVHRQPSRSRAALGFPPCWSSFASTAKLPS